MLTAHQRTRLHRQEFLDTDAAVYATQPQPAESSTEVGADDLACARGIVIAVPAALAAWAVIAAGAVTFKFWPQIAAFVGFGPV